MTVGAIIRKMREDRDWTQTELAEKVGVDQAHIARIEKGLKVPTLALSAQLADALNCTIDEIVGRRVG